jgi:hypothetical protein
MKSDKWKIPLLILTLVLIPLCFSVSSVVKGLPLGGREFFFVGFDSRTATAAFFFPLLPDCVDVERFVGAIAQVDDVVANALGY